MRDNWIKIANSAVGSADGYSVFVEVGTYGQLQEKADSMSGETLFQNRFNRHVEPEELGYLVVAKRRGSRDNYFFVLTEMVGPELPVAVESFMDSLDPQDIAELTDKRGQIRPDDEIVEYWKFKDALATVLVLDTIVSMAWVAKRIGSLSVPRLAIFVTKPDAEMQVAMVDPDELSVSLGPIEKVAEKYSPSEMLKLFEEHEE